MVPPTLCADAYLSEDKVHYGADSYTVDYDKEIVRATGHAFFRKMQRSVFADRIVIYYGRLEKRALFYDHVLVVDQEGGYRVTGERAEAEFAREYYRIEGSCVFEDDARTVRSSIIEMTGDRDILFSGEVRYSDARYEVSAPLLRFHEGVALFEKGSGAGVEALEEESGDRVFCDSIRYDEKSGDLLFTGNVLFIQGERGASLEKSTALQKSASLLVLRADEIRYMREGDTFYLSGNVYLFDGSLSLSAPDAEYVRASGVVTAQGGTTLRQGGSVVRSASMKIELDTKRLIFFDEAKGVFGAP